MSRIKISESKLIPSEPEAIYPVIADYKNGHPHILPKYFSNLEVLEGGYGAGTRVKFRFKMYSTVKDNEAIVSEPVPGAVLAETDVNTGLVSSFTLIPAGKNQTLVTISTEFEASKGFVGLMEKWFSPMMLKKVYKQELQMLHDFVLNKKEAFAKA